MIKLGNLIKTIPPEGVSVVDITASSDPLSVQINGDRINGTKTVFTDHRLATRYEYNSLNQLVTQSSPDTDPIDVFELTLPNGLHPRLNTTKIQLVTESIGYLAGSIGNRGYLYKTGDGGVTWNRINGLVGADLKKVVMIDANIGFAIGSNGTVLKTIDGASTWDMIDFWGMTGKVSHLNDIHVRDNGSGFTILIVGDNGLVAKSVDQILFTNDDSGISLSHNLSSITASTTDYYITANGNQTATSYKRTFGATPWILNEDFDAGILYSNDLTSTDRVIAGGKDGRIYVNANIQDGMERWQMIETDISGVVQDIQFFDDQQGLSIVDSKLFRTDNQGETWLSLSTDNYRHLSESSNGELILATGENAAIDIYVPSIDPTVPAIDVPINFGAIPNVAIVAGWVDHQVSGTASEYALFIATEDGRMAYTFNGEEAYPIWNISDQSG